VHWPESALDFAATYSKGGESVSGASDANPDPVYAPRRRPGATRSGGREIASKEMSGLFW